MSVRDECFSMENSWNCTDRGKRGTGREPSSSVALSTTIPNMEWLSLQKTTKNHAKNGAVNTCPVQVGLHDVRWDITESHLMLGAAPTNVKQPPRIFSPPSCNKPKSQAPLYSPHWIFAPCPASLQPWAKEGAAISWRRVCWGATRYGMHF